MSYNDLNYLIKKGDSFIRKRKFHEAIAYYNMALEKKPDDIILQTKKAAALYELGDIQQATTCFYNLTNQVGALEMLTLHVQHYQKNIGKNISEVQHILKSRYNITINQKNLKRFLKSIKLQIKDQKEQYEFEQFKREIPYKNWMLIYDYIESFLKHYGSDYKKYIPRFQSFLQEKNFNITCIELENTIRKQKTKMEKPSWNKQKNIDHMTGIEFEEFLRILFERKGYKVFPTPHNDQGADLVIEIVGIKTVVQAKRRNVNIGNSAIQQVHTARSVYQAINALVVCTSDYTKSARELAEKLKVELWDRKKLFLEMNNIHYY